MENTSQYYRRRAAEERTAAERAVSANSRTAHQDLARRYLAVAAANEVDVIAAE